MTVRFRRNHCFINCLICKILSSKFIFSSLAKSISKLTPSNLNEVILYIGSLQNLATWFPCGRGRTLFILGSLPLYRLIIYIHFVDRRILWCTHSELKLSCRNDPVVKNYIYSNGDLDLWSNDLKINKDTFLVFYVTQDLFNSNTECVQSVKNLIIP
jgi:hypothetical protein